MPSWSSTNVTPVFGDADRALALVHLVVDVLLEQRRHPRELLVPARALLRGPGDDQRGAGLVDEDGVGLVDDGVVVAALHHVGGVPGHVVAQVVEAELVVGAVGDVAGVLHAPHLRRHLREDHPDRQAEEAVDAAHVLGVALGQVVVRGDDVHALACERVEVDGEHRRERLALAGLHLGDVAQVQRGAAHQLDGERALADRAHRGLAHHGERLGQQLVQATRPGRRTRRRAARPRRSPRPRAAASRPPRSSARGAAARTRRSWRGARRRRAPGPRAPASRCAGRCVRAASPASSHRRGAGGQRAARVDLIHDRGSSAQRELPGPG